MRVYVVVEAGDDDDTELMLERVTVLIVGVDELLLTAEVEHLGHFRRQLLGQ